MTTLVGRTLHTANKAEQLKQFNMSYYVKIDKEKSLVIVNGTEYTLEQLQTKTKNRIENKVCKLAESIFKASPDDMFGQNATIESLEDWKETWKDSTFSNH
jgi:hypothetical protein